ncbi:NAD-dependent succinate-semialdehyde dehydrogenase [Cryobacterium sp. PH29-G1]|uniref:NAD-dependent succinate-semialdehyde dehydrogenase n=1 Tax=Cryobacterium sp. PH29-G1 TaxID=3046211 RepID=UPI0024BB2F89|nr:NAD-dependent succinate-semialdehyde dehydrogenase [Cryobacterium sp. PH29-G1]MDJ0348379.1 NAD-dependent succinate-semialdehyde dehydrogenase [Cryobacterium sp. PH29-G1]
MTRYAVTDPVTNIEVRVYPTATDAEVDAAIQRASASYSTWRKTPKSKRAKVLRRVAALHRSNRERLAAIITREMGKTIDEALGEVDLVADIYDYYAVNGAAFSADKPIDVASGTATVRSDPLGVLLGVMPWNYPYYQLARFIAPNLMLGNTVLLKPAPQCPESAEATAELFAEADAPEGVFLNVLATEDQVRHIIEHPAVQGVSLTGSERAGSAVGAIAGRAMKKYVLELGGSDPFIVLADADLAAAVTAAVAGRMGNAGQACTASKRFIVLDEVYDSFIADFVARVGALVVGDPREKVAFGPLASEAAAVNVTAQIRTAVDEGARVLVGGGRPERAGAFVEPTILVDVRPGARAYREEIFGPVAVVHRVASIAEAVELANDTPYGLGSVVFGSDPQALASVVDNLNVGMVSINAPSRTEPGLPFGGVKASGIGRELGEYGMSEFVNRKLIRTSSSS